MEDTMSTWNLIMVWTKAKNVKAMPRHIIFPSCLSVICLWWIRVSCRLKPRIWRRSVFSGKARTGVEGGFTEKHVCEAAGNVWMYLGARHSQSGSQRETRGSSRWFKVTATLSVCYVATSVLSFSLCHKPRCPALRHILLGFTQYSYLSSSWKMFIPFPLSLSDRVTLDAVPKCVTAHIWSST